jgi:hypothetical protein
MVKHATRLDLKTDVVHEPYKTSVNTKNWYMEETDLWAEFGRKVPFGKRFSSKHLAKALAVESALSFGRRAVSCLEEEAFGNA